MNKVRMESGTADRAWIPLGASNRFERFAEWASTKIYGKVLDPLAVSFHHKGVPAEKIRGIAEWETSAVYSPLERKVIAYAVAATATPFAVTCEMVDELRVELTDRQLVELAALVSLENYRSRTNEGLGLSSQGFKDTCEIG